MWTVRILVTGSNGFIGCHLSALLRMRGHIVFGVDSGSAQVLAWLRKERSDHSGIAAFNCDITDTGSLAELLSIVTPDVVVHLAAKPGVAGAESHPDAYDAVNTRGIQSLVRACQEVKVRRVIHASSSSVYGGALGPITETAELRPLGHYGRTKMRGELHLQAAAESGVLDVLILRPFSVIGPMGRPDMAPWRFADDLLNGRMVSVHDGAGRDFTSVHDVAMAFALAAESEISGCHVVNIGAGEPHQAIELAEGLAQAMGCSCISSFLPLPTYMPLSTHAEIGRASALLGWKPKVKFTDAVAEFGEWFIKAHRDNS